MKKKLFSYVILSLLLIVPSIQATVFAIEKLVKGNRTVYLFSNVPTAQVLDSFAAIPEEAERLSATLITGGDTAREYDLNPAESYMMQICLNIPLSEDTTYNQIKSHIDLEVEKIAPEIINKSESLKIRKRAFDDLNINGVRLKGFLDNQRQILFELLDVLRRNLLTDAVEKCQNEHIFVCAMPVDICVTYQKLKQEGWQPLSDVSSIETFARSFAENGKSGMLLEQAAINSAEPIDIALWFDQNMIIPALQATEQPEPENGTNVQERRFTSAADVALVTFGFASIAALACIAIKNNVCGWLRNKIGQCLYIYAHNFNNPLALKVARWCLIG